MNVSHFQCCHISCVPARIRRCRCPSAPFSDIAIDLPPNYHMKIELWIIALEYWHFINKYNRIKKNLVRMSNVFSWRSRQSAKVLRSKSARKEMFIRVGYTYRINWKDPLQIVIYCPNKQNNVERVFERQITAESSSNCQVVSVLRMFIIVCIWNTSSDIRRTL